MTDDTSPEVTPEDAPEQTWIAHVENGTVKARVKSEDWARYEKENNL